MHILASGYLIELFAEPSIDKVILLYYNDYMESQTINAERPSLIDYAELVIGRMAVGGSIGVAMCEVLNLVTPNFTLSTRDIAEAAFVSGAIWTTQRFKS
jgi:hypothetical protein